MPFKRDPENEGWTIGWAVVKESPWHFDGFFPEESEAIAALNGRPEYKVVHGSNRDGSDDFIYSENGSK